MVFWCTRYIGDKPGMASDNTRIYKDLKTLRGARARLARDYFARGSVWEITTPMNQENVYTPHRILWKGLV